MTPNAHYITRFTNTVVPHTYSIAAISTAIGGVAFKLATFHLPHHYAAVQASGWTATLGTAGTFIGYVTAPYTTLSPESIQLIAAQIGLGTALLTTITLNIVAKKIFKVQQQPLDIIPPQIALAAPKPTPAIIEPQSPQQIQHAPEGSQKNEIVKVGENLNGNADATPKIIWPPIMPPQAPPTKEVTSEAAVEVIQKLTPHVVEVKPVADNRVEAIPAPVIKPKPSSNHGKAAANLIPIQVAVGGGQRPKLTRTVAPLGATSRTTTQSGNKNDILDNGLDPIFAGQCCGFLTAIIERIGQIFKRHKKPKLD